MVAVLSPAGGFFLRIDRRRSSAPAKGAGFGLPAAAAGTT